MISGTLLVFTTALLGALWTTAQMLCATREWGDAARARSWALRSALVFFGLVAVPLALGGSGVLNRFDAIPFPMMGFSPYLLVVSFAIAQSRFGLLLARHLSVPVLVGFHSFRILAELVLYAGLREGLAPVALTFEGWNFDFVTGVTAIPMALYLQRSGSRRAARVWSWMGVGFLVVIAFLAATSFPSPLRLFAAEPSNEWVTHLPYTLLPGVLVVAALTGHLVLFRKFRLSEPAGN